MSKSNSFGGIDIAVAGGFVALAIASCLCGTIMPLIAGIDNAEISYELIPFLLGTAVALMITAGLVLFRRRRNIGGMYLLISMLLWLTGSAVFAFGLTAIFLYDEPTEFFSNLGYSVGLCLLPGAFLALLGLLLYALEAGRGRKTAVSPSDDSSDWLESIKAEEKAKLDDDLSKY